jgi:undecaprenyl pyrophosphate synthase
MVAVRIYWVGVTLWPITVHVRGYIQKFPEGVDNEINNNNNNNNKHLLRSIAMGYGSKTH